jgi:L-lactate dehydrogenase (cytochrome)
LTLFQISSDCHLINCKGFHLGSNFIILCRDLAPPEYPSFDIQATMASSQSVGVSQSTLALKSTPTGKIQTTSSQPKVEYVKPDLVKLISVHDFEEVAKATYSAKAYAFYSSAATDLITHHANSEFYRKIMIRPQVMRNVKNVSIKRSILGCDSSAPFFVSPAAMASLAHPDGEMAIARGCGAEGIIQIVNPHSNCKSFLKKGCPNHSQV